MTKHLLVFLLTVLSLSGLNAQVVINSDITANTTWTANNIYLLQGGCLYVRNNATLTIEPGTLIKGDGAALIILRGSKIIADGTRERPIVFTSSKPAGQRNPGDWGGIILLGSAPINVPGGEATVEGGCSESLYGGTDPADNSGTLRYVRIEFAGIPFQPNNELNSLTLGGVGTGTVIEHVQTSYGGDDAFEWFGGTVNGKWLVAYSTVDDMFDTDFGYTGKNQWVLGISNPMIADVSGSNGFESDNDGQGTTNGPKTNAHFSNVSLFGPQQTPGTTINSNFRRALHIRRCSYLDVYNSVFTGFPVGYKIESTCTIDGFTTSGDVNFKNNIIAAMATPIEPTGNAPVQTTFDNNGNSILAAVTDVMVNDPFNATKPNFLPKQSSPLLSGADFTSPDLTDAFFTPTTYRGAFGADDWTQCWAEWDPINADYSTGNFQYITKPTVTAGGATSFCEGSSVTLSAPAGFAYAWSNGATTQGITAAASGNFTVTVTNARGCTMASDPITVTVNPAPVAGFSSEINGATANFTNASSGAATYSWNFGDGTTSTLLNASHVYSVASGQTQTFNVCLTATSAAGCTNTTCSNISVTGQSVVIVSSDITSNTTWTNNNTYVLQGGCIYVRNNSTLTIQPGTVIRGNQAALIFLRGSKIMADGTVTRPIVFTSVQPAGERNPGDWGGIILLGKAPINVPGGEATVEGGCSEALYGGTDPADNSGVMRYVRIEFAGIPFQPNNELNSLTLGGVGTGTVIEHVQTSYGGDDAFEWFGGTVNGKWLVAYRTVDDMFDTDFGYTGKNQWVLGISDPMIADVSGSNAFESDNDGQGTTNGPKTNAHFTNVTILGPKQPGGPAINSNFRRALHIRRCSYLDVFNSVFTGFPVGYKIESTCTIDGFTTTGDVEFKNNVLAAMDINIEPADAAVQTQFTALGNSTLTAVQDLMLSNPFNFAGNNPDFRPGAGSPLLSGADFSSATLQDAYFTPTTYRGAFGNTDWTDCWAEWDPINANYEAGSVNYGLNPGITFTLNTNTASFTGTTAGAVSYAWDFGDGNTSTSENPVHAYIAAGSYNVTLTVTSARGCTSTATQTVTGVTATKEIAGLNGLKVFPNPFSSSTSLEFALKNQMTLEVQLADVTGRVISLAHQEFHAGLNRMEIDGSSLNAGVYFLRLVSAEGQKTVRLSVIR